MEKNYPPNLEELESKDYDGLLWGIVEDGTLFTAFRVRETKKKKPKPHELGFHYNILCFRNQDEGSIDIFEAIIGDPQKYAQGLSRVGYNGLMFKSRFLTKKEMSDGFEAALTNYGFAPKVVKKILKQFK